MKVDEFSTEMIVSAQGNYNGKTAKEKGTGWRAKEGGGSKRERQVCEVWGCELILPPVHAG